MQFNCLVWLFIPNFIAVNVTAKAVPQSLDSLSLNADPLQVPADDDPEEVMFSSSADPQAALNTDLLEVSSSDPQGGAMDTPVLNDDFLALGGTSDDIFANSCDNNLLRIRNEPSSCGVSKNDNLTPNLDLFQRLGQGDDLWKLLDTPPGSQEGSDSLEDDAEKQRLLPPFDVLCDPEFPFRLCCYGRAIPAHGPNAVLLRYHSLLLDSVQRCFRCMYFALFSRVYDLFRALGFFSISQPLLIESSYSIKLDYLN